MPLTRLCIRFQNRNQPACQLYFHLAKLQTKLCINKKLLAFKVSYIKNLSGCVFQTDCGVNKQANTNQSHKSLRHQLFLKAKVGVRIPPLQTMLFLCVQNFISRMMTTQESNMQCAELVVNKEELPISVVQTILLEIIMYLIHRVFNLTKGYSALTVYDNTSQHSLDPPP